MAHPEAPGAPSRPDAATTTSSEPDAVTTKASEPDAATTKSSEPDAVPRGTAHLVRSSSIVGLGTLLSRLTGLIRTVAIAAVLGGRTLADSYNLANTTPNMIYDLLLGGVFTATLVPVFVDHHVKRDDEGDSAVVTMLSAALVVMTVIAVLCAPWIFRLYTWKIHDPAVKAETIAVGVPLLRWFLPQILFYGLTAIGSAMLNTRRSYLAPAIAPVLNNLVMFCILGAFWRVGGVAPSTRQVLDDPILMVLLGGGTTAGIAVMAAALLPALRRAGVRLRVNFHWRHRSIRQVFGLSGWMLVFTLTNQVALAIVLALAAAEPGSGAVTAYTYAFIFFQLPTGLFTISILTTVEPEMARAVSASDMGALREQFSNGLRLILFMLIPATAVTGVLAHPIVNVMLGHGGYRHHAALTGTVLALFALGLVGYSVYLLALRCFYAQKNTRTPFFVNLVENAVNVVAAFALVGRWGVQGLTVAFALAYIVGAAVAVAVLARHIGGFALQRVWRSTWRVTVASVLAAAAGWAVVEAVGAPAGFASLPALAAGLGAIGVVFLGAAFALRIPDLARIGEMVRARLGR